MASAAGLPRAPRLHLDLAQACRAGAAQLADEGRAALRDTASLGRDRRQRAPAGGSRIAQFVRKKRAALRLVGPSGAPDRREDRSRVALSRLPKPGSDDDSSEAYSTAARAPRSLPFAPG